MKTQITVLSKLKTAAMVAATAVTLASSGLSAKAAYLDIDITGWQTYGPFGSVNNSEVFVNLGAGTQITGFDFSNLSFTAISPSWRSEFILSVNDSAGANYLDFRPSLDDSPGTFGPVSGSWAPLVDQGYGGAFNLAPDGILWVTVYESFNDAIDPDAVVNSGSLRIYYTVPEPGTAGLLGLFGLCAAWRWRKSAASRIVSR